MGRQRLGSNRCRFEYSRTSATAKKDRIVWKIDEVQCNTILCLRPQFNLHSGGCIGSQLTPFCSVYRQFFCSTIRNEFMQRRGSEVLLCAVAFGLVKKQQTWFKKMTLKSAYKRSRIFQSVRHGCKIVAKHALKSTARSKSSTRSLGKIKLE